MSNVYQLSNKDEIFEQASLWIAKLDRELTSDEEEALAQWLAENAEHKNVLFKMAELWDKMDELGRLSQLFPEEQKTSRTQKKQVNWKVGLAASFFIFSLISLVSLGSLTLFNSEQNYVVYSNTHETGIGESTTIFLPDNSKVTLNTNSRLSVSYSNDYRLLKLERGELHVEVAHDKQRPLSVVANNKIIQAVGTAFNVQVKSGEVELIVTDGKVVVGKLASSDTTIVARTLEIPKGAMAVSKGEMASLGLIENKRNKIDSRIVNANLSWQQGKLLFTGETLIEVLDEVARYTDVAFEIKSEQIKSVKIAGRFKTGDVNGLVDALNSNFNIKAEWINSKKIVLSLNPKDAI
jgi:transmembrane sensor